jgi:hypothetical protein
MAHSSKLQEDKPKFYSYVESQPRIIGSLDFFPSLSLQ